MQLAGCSGRSSGGTASPRSPARKLSVVISEVSTHPLSARAEFTGNLLPRRRTLIVSEVEGIVEEISKLGPAIEIDVDGKHYSEQLGILPGQQVRAGQVLVQLERTEFELDVAVARAKLAKAKADLAQLQAWERPEAIERLEAVRAESQARHELAVADYERAKSLASSDAVSRSELDRAAMELATSKAVLAGQEAALRQATAGPTPEETAVEQALVQQAEAELMQKQRLLAKTTITAPYDGVITEVHVEEGSHVSAASGPLLELLDLRYLVAEVGVPESYLGKVRPQDRASVTIAGSIDTVPGLVVSINNKVDAESRSFRVRVAIDNMAARFKAGQFARVTLNLGGEQRATTVPSRAITFIEGQPGVFLFEDGVARRRAVTLGMSDQEATEILTGLSPGDVIVIDDPNLLADGMEVAVRPTDMSMDREPQHNGSLHETL